MQTPNVAVQVFLSVFKWFFVVLLLNNLIWAGVHFGYVTKSFAGTSYEVSQEQSGYDNVQGLNNVSKANS